MTLLHTLLSVFKIYFFSFNGQNYFLQYIKGIQERLEDGDTAAADDLPELHATLSGLKATATVTAHANIEDARKCCGGQGFLMSSGIGKLSPDFAEWVSIL